MKFLMSSCLTTTSFFSGLMARIWPVSSYCLGGGAWRHADAAITASTATAITTRSYRQPPGQPFMTQLYRMNALGVRERSLLFRWEQVRVVGRPGAGDGALDSIPCARA